MRGEEEGRKGFEDLVAFDLLKNIVSCIMISLRQIILYPTDFCSMFLL